MRSFVRCPSCRRKLLVATDGEGGKKRCPRCRTRFVLGSRDNFDMPGPSEYVAFEVFDPESQDDLIEVLDEEAPTVPLPTSEIEPQPSPVFESAPPAPVAPVRKGKRRRAHLEDGTADDGYGDDAFFDTELEESTAGGGYVVDPRDGRRWQLVHWGISLVLLAILVYLASIVLSFISLTMAAAGGILTDDGLMPIGGIVALASLSLTLFGYGMCVNVPLRTMARSWTVMALVLDVAAIVVGLITVPVALATVEPIVVVVLFALGMMLGFASWMSFLMFLERVADVLGERGIKESVSATIKLSGVWVASVMAGVAALGIMMLRDPGGRLLSSGDPTVLILGICTGIWQAWIGILGLIVFIKYILNLLNVRGLVAWAT